MLQKDRKCTYKSLVGIVWLLKGQLVCAITHRYSAVNKTRPEIAKTNISSFLPLFIVSFRFYCLRHVDYMCSANYESLLL